MAWNSAIDLWSLIECAALAVVLVAGTMFFAEKSHFVNALALSGFWLALHAALSFNRRSHESVGQRSDAIRGHVASWFVAAVFTLLVAAAGSANARFSLRWIATDFAIGLGTITLVGVSARALISSLTEKGVIGTRVAIYGCSDATEDLLEYIAPEQASSVRVEKLFDQRLGRGPTSIRGYQVSSSLDQLVELARQGQIDAVVLDLPWEAYDRIEEIVFVLEQVNVDILMAPSRIQVRSRSRSIGMIGSIPTVSLYKRPMSGVEALAKVIVDRAMATLVLVVLSLPLFLIALLIKLESPGPIFFRQIRRGMNNEPFEMIKFRSMYVHAEDKRAERLVTRGDVRVTKVGAFIRRTSLDELPQLLNVLSGQMSLVGPRPHVWEAKAADRRYEEVVRRYPARHRVLPGLTGLAQVRGFRGNGDDENEIMNWVKSDLEYIDRWSLGLDLSILARTIVTVLVQRGAY